jgi:hypothetical protein
MPTVVTPAVESLVCTRVAVAQEKPINVLLYNTYAGRVLLGNELF